MKTVNTGKCELVFVKFTEEMNMKIMNYPDGYFFIHHDSPQMGSTHKVRLAYKFSGATFYLNELGMAKNIPFDMEFVGFTDELTESDCLEIMDSVARFKFNDFNSDKGIYYDWSLSSAKESFNSLLTANYITGRQIVLRKIEHK